ncbi:MAG: hypothetical protein K9N55_07465 [Phycisphaerae bacterium]|nr:hypothetical protein [Phycisphaerae bacterium]
MWLKRNLSNHTWFVLLLAVVLCPQGLADWQETFDNGGFDLSTWQFMAYPQLTGTFGGVIQAGVDGNDYLALSETSSAEVGGSAFGVAIGSPEEFTDVRIGAVVNAAGISAHSYVGLGARTTYFMDDGSISGYPGLIASTYLMLIHYQEGPANLRIEVFKTANLDEGIMKTYHEVLVPGVGHARSYYAELDVVGSDPVYITGSLYAHKDGPLLARTPTLVDTNVKDPWENSGFHDAVYAKGVSVVFSMNEGTVPVGYEATFDDVSSTAISPADAHVKDVAVDNFEGYQETLDLGAAWVCNIIGIGSDGLPLDYVRLNKDGNDGRLLFQYQNQYDPYVTEAVRTFNVPLDWTIGGVGTLSLSYMGQTSNVPQPMAILLEDAAGSVATVTHPYAYAVQTHFWREWDIDLTTLEGIDLTAVKAMTIRVGDGTDSGQSKDDKDRDEVFFNTIVLNPTK